MGGEGMRGWGMEYGVREAAAGKGRNALSSDKLQLRVRVCGVLPARVSVADVSGIQRWSVKANCISQ